LASKFAFFEKIITSCLTIKENPKIRRKKPQNQRKSKNLEENSKIEENPKKNASKYIKVALDSKYRNFKKWNVPKSRLSSHKSKKTKKIHTKNPKIEENP